MDVNLLLGEVLSQVLFATEFELELIGRDIYEASLLRLGSWILFHVKIVVLIIS